MYILLIQEMRNIQIGIQTHYEHELPSPKKAKKKLTKRKTIYKRQHRRLPPPQINGDGFRCFNAKISCSMCCNRSTFIYM